MVKPLRTGRGPCYACVASRRLDSQHGGQQWLLLWLWRSAKASITLYGLCLCIQPTLPDTRTNLRWPKVANHNSKLNQQQKQVRNQQKQMRNQQKQIKNQEKQIKNQQKQMNYQQQKQMKTRKNSILNLFLLLARLLLLLLLTKS